MPSLALLLIFHNVEQIKKLLIFYLYSIQLKKRKITNLCAKSNIYLLDC